MRNSPLIPFTFIFLFALILIGCQNSPGGVFSPETDMRIVKLDPPILQPSKSSNTSGSSTGTTTATTTGTTTGTATGTTTGITTGTATGTTSIRAQSSSSSDEVTVALLNVYFNITNGVSAFLDGYSIQYVLPNGTSVSSGNYDHFGALSLYVQAPAITTTGSSNTGTGGSSSSTGTTTGTKAGIRAQSTGTGTGSSGSSGTSGSTSGSGDVSFAGVATVDVFTADIFLYMTNGIGKVAFGNISPVIAKISFHGKDLNNHEFVIKTQVTLTTTLKADSGASGSGS